MPSQWLQLDLDGTTLAASAPMLGINCIHLPLDGSMALDEMDRHIIKTALERHRYNILATARALGTTRETLRYRVQKYGLNELLRAASG